MKNILFTLALLISFVSFSQNYQGWTMYEIEEADTARKITYISDFEKDVVLYHNLVRLFPQKYLELEILNWREDRVPKDTIKFPATTWEATNLDSHYYRSLVFRLKKQRPMKRLNFDTAMYYYALCLANELKASGKISHTRRKCKKVNIWENITSACYSGRDAVNSLLVDEGVKSLGHRKTILNSEISKIGVSKQFHPKFETVIVIDYCNNEICK